MVDSTAVITIRSIADLNATLNRRSGLAARGAWALQEQLLALGMPSAMTRSEAIELAGRVLAHAVLDEPSTGEAVDIAGEQFLAAFRSYGSEVA